MLKTIVTLITLCFFAGCGPKPCSDGINKAIAEGMTKLLCPRLKAMDEMNVTKEFQSLDCDGQKSRIEKACEAAGPWKEPDCRFDPDALREPVNELLNGTTFTAERKRAQIDEMIDKIAKSNSAAITKGDFLDICPK